MGIGKYKGALATLFSNDVAFIPNGILYFIVVGGSIKQESQDYAGDIKANMKFTDSSTTQAGAKAADTTEATAAKAPETGGTKGREVGKDVKIVTD